MCSLWIPRRDSRISQVRVAGEVSPELQRTILVVEDQAELLHLMCRALEMRGFEALPAEQVSQALEIVAQRGGAIDLAIADMILPGLSGLDLAAHLEREFPSLPILYISGQVESLAMQCIAHRSPQCVLLKPFPMRELVHRVELLLGTAARRGPARAGASESEPRSGSGTGD